MKRTLSLVLAVLMVLALFGAAALFNDRADYATTLTARSRCDLLFFPQALVEELMAQGTSQRDAVKQAAKTLGLSRNQLYDAVVGK